MLDTLKRNPGIKILSLFLALFFWGVATRGAGNRETEIVVPVPIELTGLPSDMEVVRWTRDSAEVRLRGPRRVMARIPETLLSLPLDLSHAQEGETTFRLFPGEMNLPDRASVVRITPASVPLLLERVVTRQVPVRAALLGTPGNGLRVGEVSVDPPQVEVRGPRSEVARLKELSTRPVRVEGATGPVSAMVGVLMPEGHIRLMDTGEVQVTVTLRASRGKE